MWDQLHRFVFDGLSVRGVFVRLDASLARNLRSHPYPPPLQRLLAEATTAVSLLATTVKIKGRISLQFQSDGPVRLLLAESTDELGLRSVGQWQGDIPEGDFSALMAGGRMALSLLPDQGQQYQGVVPLDGETLADCLEHYFQQSEQLATRILLFNEDERSAGLMIQAMPGLRQHEDFRRIALLADTLKTDEAMNLPVETVLHRLYHEEQVRLFPSQAVSFHCRCSRERCRDSLLTLPVGDLQEMRAEEGETTITCDFCSERYHFDDQALELLIQEKQQQTH